MRAGGEQACPPAATAHPRGISVFTMKPTEKWIEDWRYGMEPKLEQKTAEELIKEFQAFWIWANLESRSKTTKQRYSGALHALGGYLVEETGKGVRSGMGIREFLEVYIASGDGPLIYHDNEACQDELDTVCRKLYKYLTATY